MAGKDRALLVCRFNRGGVERADSALAGLYALSGRLMDYNLRCYVISPCKELIYNKIKYE
jgi:hypothetical protein